MPNATAQGLQNYLRLKGGKKAKEFQKIQVKDWLNDNLKNVPLEDNR